MRAFHQIRDRLPEVWRPQDDGDLADARLSLAATDVLAIECEPEMSPRLTTQGRRVEVLLPEPGEVRGIRLAAGVAPGPVYALAIFRLTGTAPPPRPVAVAPLFDGVARLAVSLPFRRIALELRLRGPLTALLAGAGASLDALGDGTEAVAQAHWLSFADRASSSPFFLRRRALVGLPPPAPGDPEAEQFPYLDDLARLGAVLALHPWRELTPERERVEAFRTRIRRMVALYQQGLATPGAIERIVEALLPQDLAAPPERHDRGFDLEEEAALRSIVQDVRVEGVLPGHEHLVGPLMHWDVDHPGVAPAPVTATITATAAVTDPMLELYATGGERPRLGLAYRGALEAGQAVVLRPAYTSWLGGDGISRADHPADPSAPGPWSDDGAAPGTVVSIAQAPDRTLWAAQEDGTLLRHDGSGWSTAVALGSAAHCLAAGPSHVLAGTDDGLVRVALHPPGEFVAEEVAGVAGPVHAIVPWPDGSWRLGTDGGERILTATGVAPGALDGIAVHAIAHGGGDRVLYGTDIGAVEHQVQAERFYVLVAESASEQDPDWEPLDPTAPPDPGAVFVPRVRALLRDRDGTLWIGTDAGLARYRARPLRRHAFTTVLEAFPDLVGERVHALAADERGAVWACTDRGLFRLDRRDAWHLEQGSLVQHGRLDSRYEPDPVPRGTWRYVRAVGRWQVSTGAGGWLDSTTQPRTTEEPPVRAIAWTDGVAATLEGGGDPVAVPPAQLAVRLKVSDDRIVDGGLPALPRLPLGRSTWRYLALEPDPAPVPPGAAAWSREGRRLKGELGLPPEPARFDTDRPPQASQFDFSVFAFAPEAQVQMTWRPREPLRVIARLRTRTPSEQIDPVVLDRVWDGILQVRPAGVRAALAVDETIVRGGDGGAAA